MGIEVLVHLRVQKHDEAGNAVYVPVSSSPWPKAHWQRQVNEYLSQYLPTCFTESLPTHSKVKVEGENIGPRGKPTHFVKRIGIYQETQSESQFSLL